MRPIPFASLFVLVSLSSGSSIGSFAPLNLPIVLAYPTAGTARTTLQNTPCLIFQTRLSRYEVPPIGLSSAAEALRRHLIETRAGNFLQDSSILPRIQLLASKRASGSRQSFCTLLHAKHGQLNPAMAHSHYEYSQPESMFPTADSAYQFSAPMSKNESHEYPAAKEIQFQTNSYNERQPYSAQHITNTDDGDLGTRSRLTQEQLATLEAEFAERYKPNTEYKKTLAERMGVEFQKVNVGDHPCFLSLFVLTAFAELVSESAS